MHRVALDAGFTCPNRDGSKARGGCLFCDAGGSRAQYQNPALSIPDQMRRGMEHIGRRFGAGKFIAYFQAFTNTYAPASLLRATYEQALVDERVVALAVATRPDCLDEDSLDVLADFSRRIITWVELGFVSEHQTVLDWCNRREGVGDFERAVGRARHCGIGVCAHVIFGLPGEPLDATIRSVHLHNRLGIESIKIHNLYIVEDAPIARQWREGKIQLPGRDDYVAAVCDFLERLRPDCAVHRLTGDAPAGRLLAPEWGRDKNATLNALRQEFRRRATRQGSLYRPMQPKNPKP